MASNALQARLVDGRDANIIMLGRIGQVLLPAVSKLAEVNRQYFVEAQRRYLNNEIVVLERQLDSIREKIQLKENELAVVEAKLPNRS